MTWTRRSFLEITAMTIVGTQLGTTDAANAQSANPVRPFASTSPNRN
jgi:hypothetical protein